MEESVVQGVPGRSLQMHHCLVTIWWVLIAACCDMVRRRVGVGGAGAAVLCSGGRMHQRTRVMPLCFVTGVYVYVTRN